jgi:hypothetical protein
MEYPWRKDGYLKKVNSLPAGPPPEKKKNKRTYLNLYLNFLKILSKNNRLREM